MHKEIHLPNGLRCVVVPVPNTHSITVFKGYNVGSRQEDARRSGAAHFIEHMMFKGTTKRPTSKEISRELDRVGAQYNAYTGKEITAYYVKVAKEHVELALDIVADMTYNPLFPQEEFEKEKGVIIEEIKMYEDSPQQYVDDVFERIAFEEGELGRDIIGTRETITNMTREDLLTYKDQFYSDANAGVVIVGNVPENIDALLLKYFDRPAQEVQHPQLHVYESTQQGSRIAVHTKSVEQIHLVLGFRSKGYLSHDAYAYSLLTTILGGGMSSPLFDEIREKRGLCYYIHMYPDLYDHVGNLVIRAGVNKEKVPEALEAMSDVLRTYKKNGVTDQELEDAKNQIIGSIALSIEDSARHADMYMKRLVVGGEALSPDERIARLQAVTKDDIMRILQAVIVTSNVSLALISDKQEHASLLDHIKLDL